MSAFRLSRWWKRPARPARLSKPRSARLELEALEERALLNARFVVPGVADNVTTFKTLQAALTTNTAALAPGDVIQIEPGSSPGSIVNADIPFIQNLTIQGDPASDVQSIPYFAMADSVHIWSSRQGFTLKNVQVYIQNGTLDFVADGAIIGCRITNQSNGIAVALQGTSAAVISGSYFENANAQYQSQSLVTVQPTSGSHNQIIGNTFVALTGSNIVLLNYSGGLGTTDVVAGNAFISSTGLSPQLVVQNDTQGLTVQGNAFTDYDSSGTAIEVHPTVENLQILDNNISFPNGGFLSDGILVDVGSPTGTSSMVIAGNQIRTAGSGSGIEFLGENGFTFNARVERNDLRGNGIGVQIDAGLGGSVAGIDLGGGPLGSSGLNDFRGDVSTSWFSFIAKDAIWTSASLAAGPIQAQGNIFGVADPTTMVVANNSDPTLAAVDVANPVSGNAAYVEALYLDFLHRTADIFNPSGAGSWVAALDQGMPAVEAANAIARSPEALGIDVDGLYHRYLNRDADPAGRAGFVAYLEAGGTLEGASLALMSSPEYQAQFPSDAVFVQSLFQNVLHRTGGNDEVASWVALLPQVGRAAVAQGFLSSAEFRASEVSNDYTQLLDRPPGQVSAAEVYGWVGSGTDILTVDVLFAASPEYQMNG
jgi:hypothetical protein